MQMIGPFGPTGSAIIHITVQFGKMITATATIPMEVMVIMGAMIITETMATITEEDWEQL